MVGTDGAHSRDLPAEDSASVWHPAASAGPRVALAQLRS